MNAIMKYPRAKWALAEWIIAHFPPHHLALLDALKAHQGPVLLSGYDSGLYREALKGWHREVRTALAQDSSRRLEVLWMNFEPPAQENLFGGEEHYGRTVEARRPLPLLRKADFDQ